MRKQAEHLTFSDIPESSPYMIKNFIVSNHNHERLKNISFDYPFSFDGIVFVICLKGYGKVKINFKEYVIEENTILTVLPGRIVEGIEQSSDFMVELLAFSFDFISDIMIPKDFDLPMRIGGKPALKIFPEDVHNLLRYHSFIINTFNNKRHPLFEHAIRGQLFSLLMEIAALYMEQDTEVREKPSSRSEEIVEQFLLLLKDHYKTERSSSFYADKLFITIKYLSGTLKKVTGHSINSWLEGATILGAKVLLKSTNYTVLQISEELSFPNPSYFGRFFKKVTGMTPKAYRDS